MRSVFYSHLVNGPFGDPALYVRLAHRGEAILFDCGDLHILSAREILKVRAVFISHAHIDHMVGFDTLLRLFLYRSERLLLFGPSGITDRIAGRLSGYTWNLTEGFPFELVVREYSEGKGKEAVFRARNGFHPDEKKEWTCSEGILMETSNYRVRAVPLDHGGIVSLAFSLEEPLHVAIHKDALERFGYPPGPWLTPFKDRIRRGDPPESEISVPSSGGGFETLPLEFLARRIAHIERGMKVVYVTDASPILQNIRKIETLAADAHLLAIEAVFSHEEFDRAKERNHLTAGLAGEIARRSGAARLLVFHHSPRYQNHPEALSDEAMRYFTGAASTSSSYVDP